MQEIEAISKVQSAEKRARELVEKAEAEKKERIAKANEEAAAIIAEAEAKARAIRAEALEGVEKYAAELRKRKSAEAQAAAAKVGRLKLGVSSKKKIAKDIVKLILGA